MENSTKLNLYVKRVLILIAFTILGIAIGYYGPQIKWPTFSLNKVEQKAQVLSATEKANIDPQVYYEVIDVVDGDTFKVRIQSSILGLANEDITVRMLGVNTPETVDPRKPPGCYGEEASKVTKSLLTDREVRLVLNPNREKVDKYDRLLAFVYLPDGLFLNEYLVREGYAKEYTYGKSYQFQKEFKELEKQAKESKLGLWGKCF